MTLPAQPNKSLIDGLACLQELAAAGEPVGGRELARRLGTEPTRAHRLVKTLTHLGFVEQLPDKRFVAGRGMHVLSAQSLYGSGLVRAAASVLERFREDSLCVVVGVLWRQHVCYLIFRRPGMSIADSIGANRPFAAKDSSIGRLLSANSSPRHVYVPRSQSRSEDSLAVAIGHPAVAGLAFSGGIAKSEVDSRCQQLLSLAADISQRISDYNNPESD